MGGVASEMRRCSSGRRASSLWISARRLDSNVSRRASIDSMCLDAASILSARERKPPPPLPRSTPGIAEVNVLDLVEHPHLISLIRRGIPLERSLPKHDRVLERPHAEPEALFDLLLDDRHVRPLLDPVDAVYRQAGRAASPLHAPLPH